MPSKTGSGKSAGGLARAAAMSKQERSDSARRAALAKAENKALPKATHGSVDHPLVIGDISIPCYVLEDGTRVLSQRGLIAGLGISYGSSQASTTGDARIVNFVEQPFIKALSKTDLTTALKRPIRFMPAHGGRSAYGYPATVLADICEAVLAARHSGTLPPAYHSIAIQCEVLVRGFARVGIIALIDEATGYQRERAKDALAKILEAWIAKEIRPYIQTFPADFYEHLFRLRGLDYPPEKQNYRPQYFGVLTNDIVYERLAPGLLKELKVRAQKDEKKAHLHRRLTEEVGHPRLKEHLASVVTVMKLSSDYTDFIEKMNRVHPRFGENYALALEQGDR